MSARARALTRDVLTYGVGEALVRAFAFVAIPIYTRLFSPAEYGTYSYVATIAGLLSAILILGGDSAFARFFLAAKSAADRQRLTTTWLTFLGAWTAVAAIAIIPLSPWISIWSFGTHDRGLLIAVAVLTIPVAIVNRMCGQVLRNEFRAREFAVLNFGGAILTVVLSVLAITQYHMGIVGIFVGALVAEVVQLPVRIWVIRSMFVAQISRGMLRELLSFGLPLVPTSIAYWVFLASDRVVLGRISTLEQVGIYTVAVTLVAAAGTALVAVGQAWTPHAVAAFETDEAEAASFVAVVATNLIAAFGFLAVLITVFADEALDVLSPASYGGAVALVPPLALAMVSQAATNVTMLGISLRKKTIYLAGLAWAAAVLNVVLNVLVDGQFGALGAAWATTVTYVALAASSLIVSQRLWHVPFQYRKAVVAGALIVAFTLAAAGIPDLGVVGTIVVKVAYVAAYGASLLALGVVDRRAAALAMRSVVRRE